MKKTFEDIELRVGKHMWLTIKEIRGSSTLYTRKEGYEEVTKNTRTHFHWKLSGISSKFSADTISSPEFDFKTQEIYNIEITSHSYDWGNVRGFKSREDAIKNALDFAKRNGIEIDGYKAKS